MGAFDFAGRTALGFTGPLGIAASFLLPDITTPFMDRIRDARNIQNMTMAKIVGGSSNEADPSMGMGFNATAARSIDNYIKVTAANDRILKEGDWQKLLEMGIQFGQFDYANNSEQYKEILRKMRKTMSTVMEVIGSSEFEDVMREMKRMQDMGAKMTNFMQISRREDMYGRITGLTHDQLVDTYGQQGALVYNQAGLTGYQGSLQAMANAAMITMGQRMGLVSEGQINRAGGVSGLAQKMTQQDANATQQIADLVLPYLMTPDATGLEGNVNEKLLALMESTNWTGLLAQSWEVKTRTPEQQRAYRANRANLMEEMLNRVDQDLLMGVIAHKAGRDLGFQGVEATQVGLQLLGHDAETAAFKANAIHSGQMRQEEEREMRLAKKKYLTELEVANNPFNKLARSIESGWVGFKEWLYGGWVERRLRAGEVEAAHANGIYNYTLPTDPNSGLGRMISPGAYLARKPDGGDKGTTLGNLSMQYEDELKKGPGFVSYDPGGGTSYGIWQIETRHGTMSDFISWLEKKGGEENLAYAKKLREGGVNQNYGSLEASENSQGARTWRELNADDKFIDRQFEFLKEKAYDQQYQRLRPEVKQVLEGSSIARQVLFSFAAQHGENRRVADLFNRLYKPGMDIRDYFRQLYAHRTEFVQGAEAKENFKNNRYKRELATALEAYEEEEKTYQQQQRTSPGSIGDFMGMGYEAFYRKHRSELTPYSVNRDPKTGPWDCSSWASQIIGEQMLKLNGLTGEDLFTQKDISFFLGSKRDDPSDNADTGSIFPYLEKRGAKSLKGDDVKVENLRPGMVIGWTKAGNKRNTSDPRGHIGIVYQRDNKIYIADMHGGRNGGVSEWEAGVFIDRYKKNELVVYDVPSLATNPQKEVSVPKSRYHTPENEADIKKREEAAARGLREAMKQKYNSVDGQLKGWLNPGVTPNRSPIADMDLGFMAWNRYNFNENDKKFGKIFDPKQMFDEWKNDYGIDLTFKERKALGDILKDNASHIVDLFNSDGKKGVQIALDSEVHGLLTNNPDFDKAKLRRLLSNDATLADILAGALHGVNEEKRGAFLSGLEKTAEKVGTGLDELYELAYNKSAVATAQALMLDDSIILEKDGAVIGHKSGSNPYGYSKDAIEARNALAGKIFNAKEGRHELAMLTHMSILQQGLQYIDPASKLYKDVKEQLVYELRYKAGI